MKSRDIDKSVHSGTNVSRTDLMHGFAKKYKDHKTQLRQAYKEINRTPDHKFEPIINPKSIKIA